MSDHPLPEPARWIAISHDMVHTIRKESVRKSYEKAGWVIVPVEQWLKAKAEVASENAALVAEIEALKADALRYRWIREVKNDWSPMFNQTPEQFKEAWAKLETGKCFDTLDAAIDSAIAGSKKEGK